MHRSGVLPSLTWLVARETAAVSARYEYTIQPCAPCHFMQSHIRTVHAYLAVSCAPCHLHFGQNDRDLVCATAVTRGGTDTEITVSTDSWPWRRQISRCSCRDSNPRPFNHEAGALTTELSPHPGSAYGCLFFLSFSDSKTTHVWQHKSATGLSTKIWCNVCNGRNTCIKEINNFPSQFIQKCFKKTGISEHSVCCFYLL